MRNALVLPPSVNYDHSGNYAAFGAFDYRG